MGTDRYVELAMLIFEAKSSGVDLLRCHFESTKPFSVIFDHNFLIGILLGSNL